jgi:hypothetical protein
VAGLADVDVGVHQAGHEHLVGAEFQGFPAGQRRGVQRLDGGDGAVGDGDGQGALGFGGEAGDGAAGADEQVGNLGHDLDIKL